MARNGSGTMTPSVDFTTEAASPPLEIAKLDTVLDDMAAEITNSIAADGQTNPSANLKMNGFKHTNVGAATALTDYVRLTELIDQDHIFYVDSGSANTYVITPSPAIAAYEEGQRFVFRATNASTNASTLNVNGLGAIAIQTVDGSTLITNSIVAGGFYEVTYDANASPDRWVLTSPASRVPDGMLSSNVALRDASNTFTGVTQTITAGSGVTASVRVAGNNQTPGTGSFDHIQASDSIAYLLQRANAALELWTNGTQRLVISSAGNYDFKSGTVTTANSSASEVGYKGTPPNAQSGSYTTVAADGGRNVVYTGTGGHTITVDASEHPPGQQVVIQHFGTRSTTITIALDAGTLFLEGTGYATTGSRTLAAGGHAVVWRPHSGSANFVITGVGLT